MLWDTRRLVDVDLELGCNLLGDRGMTILCERLAVWPPQLHTLRLGLRHNDIGSDGAASLMRRVLAPREGHVRSVTLDLSHNPCCHQEEGEVLLLLPLFWPPHPTATNLHSLTLYYNSLTSAVTNTVAHRHAHCLLLIHR